MKNTEKKPIKPKTPGKTRKTTAKKPKTATVKKPRSGARSGAKRRKKPGFSDAVRAIILAGILIVVSGFISMAVIIVHSTMSRPPAAGVPAAPEIERPAPIAAVPAEQPAPASAVPAPTSAPAKPTERPESINAAPAAAVSTIPAERPTPASTAPVKAPAQSTPATVSARPAERTAPTNAVPTKTPEQSTPAATVPARPAAGPPPTTSTVSARPASAPPERPEQPKPEHRGTLIFVIDDAGNNLKELEPFLKFPGPLTIAVLPGLPHSAEAARRIRAAGKEVFLHQPMEAVGGQAPGPGAIYSGMNADEIRAVLKRNVTEIGPIAGMNNHQGSKVTMDQEAMETVLAFCREQGLYFLDSKTIAETAVPAAAAKLGIKIGERDVFVDNDQAKSSMIRYIREGLARSEQGGSAVMIGHTWSPALAPLLAELYQDFIKEGYSLSTASALISGRTK